MANKKTILICDICKSRNYTFYNSQNELRLELSKYCPKCTKHTIHKQSR